MDKTNLTQIKIQCMVYIIAPNLSLSPIMGFSCISWLTAVSIRRRGLVLVNESLHLIRSQWWVKLFIKPWVSLLLIQELAEDLLGHVGLARTEHNDDAYWFIKGLCKGPFFKKFSLSNYKHVSCVHSVTVWSYMLNWTPTIFFMYI